MQDINTVEELNKNQFYLKCNYKAKMRFVRRKSKEAQIGESLRNKVHCVKNSKPQASSLIRIATPEGLTYRPILVVMRFGFINITRPIIQR